MTTITAPAATRERTTARWSVEIKWYDERGGTEQSTAGGSLGTFIREIVAAYRTANVLIVIRDKQCWGRKVLVSINGSVCVSYWRPGDTGRIATEISARVLG